MSSRFGTRIRSLAAKLVPDILVHPIAVLYFARSISSMSEKQEPDFAIMNELVRPGDLVVDIGANVGDYTKRLSDLVGHNGRVLAIEPVPRTFRLLSGCTRLLRLKNVSLYNLAVSNHDGVLDMAIPTSASGNSNYYLAHVVGQTQNPCSNTFRAESRRLDALVDAELGPVAFLKCDVEGHEYECLLGALETIDRDSPALLIELSGDPDDPGAPAGKVKRLLESRSYSAFWFDGRAFRARQGGDKSVNYFFLKEHHLGLVRKTEIIISTDRKS